MRVRWAAWPSRRTSGRRAWKAAFICRPAIPPIRSALAATRPTPFDAILIDAPCSGTGVIRSHPDHTTGFNIERQIRLDFDGASGDALEAAGYGVDRISGTYREEIFGLHKPLGPDPVNQPVGLKTEGHFQLNRISTLDTLNTL